MKKFFFISIILFAVISCQIDENPNLNLEGNLLVKIEPEALLASETGWVMVHDTDGNLLDYGRVTGGSQNYFDTQSENVIHITLVKSGSLMILETITNVSAEEEYSFGLKQKDYSPGDHFERDQPVEIILNHTSPILNIVLSHFTGDYSHFYYPPRIGNFNTVNSALANSKKQKSLYPTMITARGADNQLRFLEGPPETKKNENPIKIEFNEMIPFGFFYDIPVSGLESFHYEVSELGVDDTEYPAPSKYFKSRMVDIGNHELLKSGESFIQTGYPYTNKRLYFMLTGKFTGGVPFRYHTYGSFPENLQIPKNETISIQDPNPQNLNFNSSYNYDRFNALWQGHGELDSNGESKFFLKWHLTGEKTGIRIVEIPSEIQNSHPVMKDSSKWILSSLTLTKSTLTFDKFIKNNYVKFRTELQEETSIGFNGPFN